MLHIGHQREELDIELKGKKLNKRDSFVYIQEEQCVETGRRRERPVRRRVQAGASAWRAIEGGYGGPADLKKTEGHCHEHWCHTTMPVRNGNLGSDQTTTTKAASVQNNCIRKNSKSNEGTQAKNGGNAGEFDRETGEEQITLGWTRRKDGG